MSKNVYKWARLFREVEIIFKIENNRDRLITASTSEMLDSVNVIILKKSYKQEHF